MKRSRSARRRLARARIASEFARAGRVSIWGSTTGFKTFARLMLALLPLGILAVFGTVQTIRGMETERVAALNLTATEGASRLLGGINNDRSAMRVVANYLEGSPQHTTICGEASQQLHSHGRQLGFAMFDLDGKLLCRSGHAPVTYDIGGSGLFDQQATLVRRPPGLIVRINSIHGRVHGIVNYGPAELAAMTGVTTRAGGGYLHLSLSRGRLVVPLFDRGQPPPAKRLDIAATPLNLGDMRIEVRTARPPVDLLRFAATILPIIMWFAAAAVGWWVVNHYLIRPLIRLNAYVAAYQPGTMLGPLPSEATLAEEIITLGETFREIAEDVVEHEAQLADALVQQRALTREVHHRVKNNLQIIASLINLHSRASATPEAADAYASIQRRVDALSVVHRNHYAATEYSQGIDAQALISELASGLRASAPGGHLVIRVAGDNLYLSQDVAVPTAFLITELIELVILMGQPSPVLLSLRHIEGEEGMAELGIASDALKPSPDMERLLGERFGRVLTGLSRQLRAPLDYIPEEGRYSMRIAARSDERKPAA